MTIKEAEKILTIMLDADGGCYYCARSLMLEFCRKFPEFREIAENIYNEEFRRELFDTKP